MAFTKFTDPIDHIANLSDRPNDTDGMNAQALKAAFDQGFADTQDYLNNTLIPELDVEQDKIAQLQQDIEDIEAGAVTEDSVNTAAIQNLAVTTAKLADLAVTAAKIANLTITAAKIANSAIETAKLADRAVTGPKIALAAVSGEHLGSKVVKQANIGDGAVGTTQIADSAVTLAKTAGIQKEINVFSGTLTAAGWSNEAQALTIQGMTATCNFVAAPNNSTGWAAAADAMLYPPTAGANTLTFTCDSVPAADIHVTVFWWEA